MLQIKQTYGLDISTVPTIFNPSGLCHDASFS
jgi:hypothetical protein